MTDVAKRVTVTSPRTRAARRTRVSPLEEQDVVGRLLVRSLLRAQLGLGLRVAAVFASLFGGLPLLFAAVPAARDTVVLNVRLPWLLLAVLAYPALALGGWLYVRLAERQEREFVELVERS